MNILENPYFLAALKIFMIVYASIFAPRLPESAIEVLKTTPMKIIFIALIAFTALKDIQMSLLLAVVFVLSINVISGRDILESYANMEAAFTGKKNPQGLIEPTFYIYPGCLNMTLQNLLDFFQNDEHKLQDTVHYVFKAYENKINKSDSEKALLAYARYAGMPHNVALNDKNAPFIATLLLQYGYKLSDTCIAPQ